MAIAAGAIWEIRSTATAGNVNGGFFVPGGGGTDYSQQDAAQYGFTDLASSNATNATPTVSSASHTFVTADIGNALCISNGTNFTTGQYQIVSISSGNAVLDRACGSSASVSGGTYKVGGAISLGGSGTAGTIVDSTVGSTVQPGNKIYFKSSNTLASTFTVSNGTAATAPIIWEGYQTARGDAPTGSNRPTLNCAGFTANCGASNVIKYMILTGTNTNTHTSGSGSILYRCKFISTSATATRVACNMSSNTRAIECEMVSVRGNAVNAGAGSAMIDCVIHSSDKGIAAAASFVLLKNCIIYGCYTAAIETTSSSGSPIFILNNTFIGSPNINGTGLTIASGYTNTFVANNIFYGFTNGLVDSSTFGQGGNNNFYNNTSNSTTWNGTNDIALNPTFTSLTAINRTGASTSTTVLTDAGADFSSVVDGTHYVRVISGSGVTVGMYPISSHTTTTITSALTFGTGSSVAYEIIQVGNLNVGTNMQGVGYPSAWPTTSTTNYEDIGAAQRNPTSDYTDPGEANVKTGTAYLYGNASKNGTYDGSDRWTDPGVANVRSATAYKANSTSNNRTGTVVVPTAGNVKTGVTYEASSGTTGTYDGSDRWTDPGVANVRSATAYKANNTSNNRTGTLDLPAEADVKIAVTFDGVTKTGTYDGSDRWSDPGSINVKEGTEYKANATVNNKTGSFIATPLPQKISHNLGVSPDTGILSGALYIIRDNNVITADLGDASYELLNPDGSAIGGGIGETGISADVNGLYFITPVDLSALDKWPNYLLVITIEARSVEYSEPFKFGIEDTTGGGGSTDLTPVQTVVDAIKLKTDNLPSDPASETTVNTRVASDDARLDHLDADISSVASGGVPADTIADAVWDRALTDNNTAGTFGGFVQKLLTVAKFLGLQ